MNAARRHHRDLMSHLRPDDDAVTTIHPDRRPSLTEVLRHLERAEAEAVPMPVPAMVHRPVSAPTASTVVGYGRRRRGAAPRVARPSRPAAAPARAPARPGPRPAPRRIELRSPLAALALAVSAAFATSLLTGRYAIPPTGELLVPILAASAFAAWFVFGLLRPARALPAILAAPLTFALLTEVPVRPPPQVSLAVASLALALGAVLAAKVGRAR